MSSLVVCDSSALIAMLLDAGPDGQWATQVLSNHSLAAPSLLPYETSNVIRRLELSGRVGSDQTAQAHRDLLDLPVQLWPFEAVALRVRELRDNLTAYDAAYVALAELLGCPLLTLDSRIAGAPGLRCDVQTP